MLVMKRLPTIEAMASMKRFLKNARDVPVRVNVELQDVSWDVLDKRSGALYPISTGAEEACRRRAISA